MRREKDKPSGEPGLKSIREAYDRILSQTQDSEQTVIGCILGNPDLYQQIKGRVRNSDFYFKENKLIVMSFEDLDSNGVPIDEITVQHWLQEKGLGGEVTFSYLGICRDFAVPDEHFMYHVNQVKTFSINKTEEKLVERYRQACQNGASSEVKADLQHQLMGIWTGGSNGVGLNLKPVSIKDLIDHPIIESRWGGIIYPEAITQLNGEPGSGKTTLIYALVLHGAKGRPFLGIPFDQPIKTLYIDCETPSWRLRSKLEMMLRSYSENGEDVELPEGLDILDGLDLRKDFQDLLALCKSKQYHLIVFDTQSRIFRMEKENDNSEANFLMGLLRELARETHCAIILVHHTTKAEEGSGVYRGRGASAIAGAVDIVVNMIALEEDTVKLVTAKNRLVGTNPTLYLKKMGEDTFEPYTPPDTDSGFEIFKAQAFLNSLSDLREWTTSTLYQLGKDKGFSESTMKRAISKLAESGTWKRIKKGVYKKMRTGHGSKSSGYIPDPIDPLTHRDNSDNDSGGLPEYL